jgi:hypothetical protein
MRFFRRGADAPPDDFWTWWADGRVRVAAAISADGFDDRLVEEISRAVRTIEPGMAWELAAGVTAEHAFCLSPEGDARRRQMALRWLESAPAADATWEYHASRQPAPRPLALDIGGARFDLGDVRAISSWDPARRRVDVRLWHPGFPDAPGAIRQQVGLLFLDNLLGEDEVERWIGAIELLEVPTGGRTPDELKDEIDRRKAEPAGEESWVLITAELSQGGVAVVTANAGLKRIDHPFADIHVEIAVNLPEARLPTNDEAAQLNAEEDALLARFEERAVYAGRTTEPGWRTMHFVSEDLERLKPAIDGWAETLADAWPNGERRRLKVNADQDMDWAFQRDLGVR